MRTYKFTTVLFVTLFLAACGGRSLAPSAVAPSTVTANESVWQLDQESQTHVPSQVSFPEQIQDFVRVEIKNFDASGADVAAIYRSGKQNKGRRNEITVYATHISKFRTKDVTAEAYAQEAGQAIKYRWKQAKYLQGGSLKSRANPFVAGPFHLFSVELRNKPHRTGVWTKRHGDWLLKARFTYTYKESDADKAMKLLKSMLAEKGGPQGLTISTTNKDGAAPGMEQVVQILESISWEPV